MPIVSCFGGSVPTRFELFKLLRVIGEDKAQTIIPVDITVPGCPTRLVKVDITTANETFHLFTNKVVKQGLLVIRAVVARDDKEDGADLVSKEGCFLCREITEAVPFMATLDIPGVCPGKEVDIQFKNVLIEHDLVVENGVLTGKVHLVEFVKVSEFVQRFLCTTESPVVVHPKTKCISR